MTRIKSLVVTITLLVMLALAGNSIWRGTGLDSGWGLLIGSILGAIMGGKELADRLAKAVPAAVALPTAAQLHLRNLSRQEVMNHLLDLLLFAARVVLIMFCARHGMLLLGNAVRTYSELSSGIGGFMYVLGVALDYAHLSNLIPGHDLPRLICAIGLALAVLPYVLQWSAPKLYDRISQEC